MSQLDMQELYNTNADFRGYVDRLCRTGTYTVDYALQLALTQEVAKYYLEDADRIRPEVLYA